MDMPMKKRRTATAQGAIRGPLPEVPATMLITPEVARGYRGCRRRARSQAGDAAPCLVAECYDAWWR